MKVKQAVILVAGRGKRARPLTLIKPKPLLKFFNKTILEHNLNQLNGITKEVILVVGYKGGHIKDFIGSQYKNLKIKYIWQKKRLGTGDAVKRTLPYIKDKFIIMNGDDLYNKKDILRCLKNFPCILLAKVKNPDKFGQVIVQKGLVKNLIEKPRKTLSRLINCGFYFLDKSFFNFKIKKSLRGEYEITDYIRKLVKKEKIYWTPAKKWIPFSLSSDLIKKNNFLLKKPPLNQRYVIGIDGGGTKTVAALANLKGKILIKSKTGSASPRNIGLKKAMNNVAQVIEKIFKKNIKYKNIISAFLGLPTIEEEFKFKKQFLKKELKKHKKILPIFKGKLTISSDQLVGFRSGTDEKDGVVLISGSGGVAHGWSGKKEVKIAGWGYLTSQGSAFSVGQKALLAVLKEIDGRGPKTLITKLIFKELKVNSKEKFIEKIYSKKPTEIIPSFSILVEKAVKKNDKIARNILIEAGNEAALSANTTIKKLNLQKTKFPLVLIGSMFKSKIILNTVKKEIKKTAPRVEFIQQEEPVKGAVKLAIEQIKTK